MEEENGREEAIDVNIFKLHLRKTSANASTIFRFPTRRIHTDITNALSEHLLTPLQTDSDGVKYFDYMEQMLLTAGGIGGGPVRRSWYDEACKLAQERIEHFKYDRDRQAKWRWFLDKLVRRSLESENCHATHQLCSST